MRRRTRIIFRLFGLGFLRAVVLVLALGSSYSHRAETPGNVGTETPDTPAAKEESIDWQKERQFWAFQSPQRHALPKVANESWPAEPLDHFILAKLEAAKLTPAAPASRGALIRRVTLDLTGVPPT